MLLNAWSFYPWYCAEGRIAVQKRRTRFFTKSRIFKEFCGFSLKTKGFLRQSRNCAYMHKTLKFELPWLPAIDPEIRQHLRESLVPIVDIFFGPQTLDLSFQKAYASKHFLASDCSMTSFLYSFCSVDFC